MPANIPNRSFKADSNLGIEAITGMAVFGAAFVGFMIPLLFKWHKQAKIISFAFAVACAFTAFGWGAFEATVGLYNRCPQHRLVNLVLPSRTWFEVGSWVCVAFGTGYYLLTGRSAARLFAMGVGVASLGQVLQVYMCNVEQQWFGWAFGVISYACSALFLFVNAKRFDVWGLFILGAQVALIPAVYATVLIFGYNFLRSFPLYHENIALLIMDFVTKVVMGIVMFFTAVAAEQYAKNYPGSQAALTPQETVVDYPVTGSHNWGGHGAQRLQSELESGISLLGK